MKSIILPVKKLRKIFFVIFWITLLLPCLKLHAQGDLLIYPKRLIFDGSKRSQDLNLVNNGRDTARYVISAIQIRMKEDGAFETIEQPDEGQQFADKNFRFFPRTVVLGPKESQTVKIQLIQFSNLSAGEYRSHIYFRAEKENTPTDKATETGAGQISIKIVPVYGISIPVLIRSGESTTNISLSQISLKTVGVEQPVLFVNLNRSGNMSVYGNFLAVHISPEGIETNVARVNGLALYTPNTTRRVQLKLDNKAGVDYTKGTIHIVFTDVSGKTEKVAQHQFAL